LQTLFLRSFPRIDKQKSTIYNRHMGGLIEPSPLSNQDNETNFRPILIAVVLVIVLVGVLVLISREAPKNVAPRHPYAAKIQLSDLKMSAAENFVGASVTYVDGNVTNTGDKTVTRAIVHVVFKNSLDEVAQKEDVPLRILQTSGPYPEAVDLSVSPLAPSQSKPFRLTFEHVSAEWNQAYPDLQITDVSLK
jgi:hypothetical protein